MQTVDIQRALIKAGFLYGAADGKLGPATKKAIVAYQIAHGLAADGKVGQLTEAALDPTGLLKRDDDLPTFAPTIPQAPKAGAGRWPLQRDCMAFYGGVGLHQTPLKLPFPMRIAWNKSQTIQAISVHERVHDSAARAFAKIADAYDAPARAKLGIDLFGGSLNVRRMRGGNSYSMHSWGIAIDFDPERNQLKWGRDRARLAQGDAEPFWKAWESEGWISLGRSRNFDWMHVQAARLG